MSTGILRVNYTFVSSVIVAGRRGNQDASRLTVIVLQHLVVDGWGHANGLSREVGVVVETLSHRHTCRRLAVSRQQAEHVVLSSVPGGTPHVSATAHSRSDACEENTFQSPPPARDGSTWHSQCS